MDLQLVQRGGRHLQTQRGGTDLQVLDRGDVHGHEPDADIVALVDATLHRDDRVIDQLVPQLDQRPREHGDLHRAVQVLQHEDGHLVALLRELAGQVGDHAPQNQHRAVVTLERLGDATVDLAAQCRLNAEQGVIGHVQPEHLLLEAQAVALVELVVGNGDALVEAETGLAADLAEQAHHTLVTFTSPDQRGVDDLFEHHQRGGGGRGSRTRRP
jgi:hypothetical protein